MSEKSDPRRRPRLDEKDFTGGGIHMLTSRFRGTTGDAALDARIVELARDAGCAESSLGLVAEMIITALKTGRDNTGVADLKLITRALKEMRRANRVFHPYRQTRKIVCYGSARTTADRPEYLAALQFSKRMVEQGYMVITGAGDGIMGAAQKGAGRDSSFGLNIALPFEQSANETIDGDPKLIEFNYFFTRKLAFVKEAHAFALFPGGFGTMDEGFELLTLIQTGKSVVQPIVMIDAPGGTYWKTFDRFLREHFLRLGLISPEDFNLFFITDSVEDAVAEIENFFSAFHSYRQVGSELVIRLNRALPPEAVERLNHDFHDLLAKGQFVQREALPVEADEPDIELLPRLVYSAKRKNFGRLRQLIDTINRLGAKTNGASNGE